MTFVEKILNGGNIRQVIEEYSLSEGKLVPDSKGVIILGDLAKIDVSIKSIDIKTLTDANEGDDVWVYFNKSDSHYTDTGERKTENKDYIKKGKIETVYVDDNAKSLWGVSKRVQISIKFIDGKTVWVDSQYGLSGSLRVYTSKEAAKLVDASNKRKGIDAAAETISAEDLEKRSDLKHLSQKFNSVDYGEDSTITIGCRTVDSGKGKSQVILYCYIAPNGGGHVNHGSTIEVGYTYVNGKLKRHVGAFTMPYGSGWIDNNKVLTTSLNQFDKDVNFLKQVQKDPEKYSVQEIMKNLK